VALADGKHEHRSAAGSAGIAHMPRSDVAQVHATASLGRVDVMKKALVGRRNRASAGRLLLEAVLAQYAAEMDRSTAFFAKALRVTSEDDRAYIVDLYVPMLLMRRDFDKAAEVLQSASIVPQELRPLIAALGTLLRAMQDDSSNLAPEDELTSFSDLQRARVLQRLATASYYVREHGRAIEQSQRAARLFDRVGSHRSAVAALSVAYNVQHVVLGDVEAALSTARKMTLTAEKARDRSIRIGSLVAEYEIMAEFGDSAAVARLKKTIHRAALPTMYQERFPRAVADALPHAWNGDFAAFKANAVVMRTLPGGRSVASVASAFESLADAALGDVNSARKHSRSAIALAALPAHDEAPYEVRYRRIARALAAATCILIGDSIRGQRAMRAKVFSGDADAAAIVSLAEGGDWKTTPRRIRGYARIVAVVRDVVLARSYCVLTPTEIDVLRILAEGRSAVEVALELHRSVHTIRAHTRNIIEKLEVSGRGAAISQARKAGLIP
jgi:DNA-binding CsgD family transcriptional regulator/tetratricopeptide (TPR) repeat protein